MEPKTNRPVALWLLGNFGVGKSTLIDAAVVAEHKPYWVRLSNDWYVFGSKSGADGLSSVPKVEAWNVFGKLNAPTIVTGVYYSRFIDYHRMTLTHRVHPVVLSTTKANNVARVRHRGGSFNEKTWADNANLLLRQETYFRKANIPFTVLDNNRPVDVVKSDYLTLLSKLYPDGNY